MRNVRGALLLDNLSVARYAEMCDANPVGRNADQTISHQLDYVVSYVYSNEFNVTLPLVCAGGWWTTEYAMSCLTDDAMTPLSPIQERLGHWDLLPRLNQRKKYIYSDDWPVPKYMWICLDWFSLKGNIILGWGQVLWLFRFPRNRYPSCFGNFIPRGRWNGIEWKGTTVKDESELISLISLKASSVYFYLANLIVANFVQPIEIWLNVWNLIRPQMNRSTLNLSVLKPMDGWIDRGPHSIFYNGPLGKRTQCQHAVIFQPAQGNNCCQPSWWKKTHPEQAMHTIVSLLVSITTHMEKNHSRNGR